MKYLLFIFLLTSCTTNYSFSDKQLNYIGEQTCLNSIHDKYNQVLCIIDFHVNVMHVIVTPEKELENE